MTDTRQLQDTIFSLRDENLELKKRLSGSDEVTKKYETIYRLMTKIRQLGSKTGTEKTNSGDQERETSEFMKDLKSRVETANRDNSTLKSKLLQYQAIHDAESNKKSNYSHIAPRIESVIKF